MSSNSSSGVARITSEARRALQVLVWPSIHLALHLDLPCLCIQPRRAPSARLALCSSLHPPCLGIHPRRATSARLGLYLSLHSPCLCMHPRRATSARLAFPSILAFSWTSPAFAFSPDELQALVWPFIHLSTTLAFASPPDELQVLVWALRSPCPSPRPPLPSHSAQTSNTCSSSLSLHLALFLDLPCLCIQPRWATRARLGSLFISPLPLPSNPAQTSYKRSSGLRFFFSFHYPGPEREDEGPRVASPRYIVILLFY